MKVKIIVLIPAYEPSMVLIDLLKELKKNKVMVVVVDDGSGNEYKKIFDEASNYASVVSYEVNKGKGGALKTGLEYITKNNELEYVVVTMDSDGQHSVRDALKLGNYARSNLDELVLGKRVRGNNTPFKSKLGNSVTRFIYRVSTGVDIYDTQTGLRAFSSKFIPLMLEIKGDRFEYEMNVLIYFALNKIKIKEIEIETIYIDDNSGTHFKPIRDSFLIYKEIIKFYCSSLFCFLIDYIMYIVMLFVFNNIVVSNIVARIFSGSVNFYINKRFVFKNKKNIRKTLFLYSLLVCFVLVINSVLLSLMVNYFMVNKYLAKVIVEIVISLFSFIIQRRLIFC